SRFHDQLAERLRRLPGVDAVAIANKGPTLDPRRESIAVDGAPPSDSRPFVVFGAHGARLAPARDCRADAEAVRRLDGRRPGERRARDDAGRAAAAKPARRRAAV